jgi:hypothetical protein
MPESDPVRVVPPENGVIILAVAHYPEAYKTRRGKQLLREKLLAQYREARKDPAVRLASCVVEIESEVGGTPLNFALDDLRQEVVANGGKVVCLGYPRAYLASLASVGVTDARGFFLEDKGKRAQAVRFLAALAPPTGQGGGNPSP